MDQENLHTLGLRLNLGKKKKKKSYPGEEWTEKGQMLREQKEFKKYFERMDFFVQGPSMGESMMMMMINAIIR